MKTILVVDDDKKIRQMYVELLSGAGFNVREASNAWDANELLKQEKIDLALLDIKMPMVNGCTFFEVVKLFHPAIKVIIASVYPLSEQKHLIDSATDYHDKSEGINVLLSKVRAALSDDVLIA